MGEAPWYASPGGRRADAALRALWAGGLALALGWALAVSAHLALALDPAFRVRDAAGLHYHPGFAAHARQKLTEPPALPAEVPVCAALGLVLALGRPWSRLGLGARRALAGTWTAGIGLALTLGSVAGPALASACAAWSILSTSEERRDWQDRLLEVLVIALMGPALIGLRRAGIEI